MKITKRHLRRIIKEEKHRLLKEFGSEEFGRQTKEFEPIPQVDGGVSMLDLDDYDDLRESLQEFAKEFAHNTGYQPADIINAMKSITGEL